MADEGKQAWSDAWGDDISAERKAVLEQRLQAWEQETDHGERKGPFDGDTLTGADVSWLAARTLAGTNEERAVAEQMERLNRARGDARIAIELRLDCLHLEGADLRDAHLEEAIFLSAHLEGAAFGGAHLEGAAFNMAHLEVAHLDSAHLEGASFGSAHLEGALLDGAYLEKVFLRQAHLEVASLNGAQLEGADLVGAHLEGAYLVGAHLAGANLDGAHLEGKTFREDDEDYQRIRTWKQKKLWAGYNLSTTLPPADLRGAFFDSATSLAGAVLGDASLGGVSVADVRWGDVNLAVVDWSQVVFLRDERRARQRTKFKTYSTSNGTASEKKLSRTKHRDMRQKLAGERLRAFQDAARANRQLAIVLRSQGIADEADRFAYRAQLCQRVATRKQHRYLRYTGSLLLDLLAGYGYRPGRAILLYLAVIVWFANFYVWASNSLITLGLPPSHVQPLAWYEALILSVSSFHGRGFQPFQNLNDPVAALAGIQAVFGLVIEVSFIATFTQRFFGK